jgi:hypothetical protein
MAKKQIKVVNNMPSGALGLDLDNGKTHVLRQPGAFKLISSEEIWTIFNSCKLIQKGHLFIDDVPMRVELGLEEDDSVDVNAMSRDDLRVIVKESDIQELKEVLESDLSDGTKEKIVILAREEYKENGFDAKRLKLIENQTGLPVAEDNGDDVETVNDTKETKKVKRSFKKKTDK